MSDTRLRHARDQRDWLEARETTQELTAAEQEARNKVTQAVADLVQVSIALAEAERDEDSKNRKMLGKKPSLE